MRDGQSCLSPGNAVCVFDRPSPESSESCWHITLGTSQRFPSTARLGFSRSDVLHCMSPLYVAPRKLLAEFQENGGSMNSCCSSVHELVNDALAHSKLITKGEGGPQMGTLRVAGGGPHCVRGSRGCCP
jgi:hypothetical protein